ncbi:LPS biosynthesis-related glycosyltransferase [Ktedonobacter sp. SOSP1-52]|uniref:glycosyltransferase family 9 protein n=1 Tax=Ktedonobacter sp. SOSP1-52 TaxID=2778366 RepID=UPI0019161AB4|nr:glycosyltransferase family 9 protein [Ktedonobacter sp. SOSP1-52]GHO70748.1 LPS biosynthesis-related glycosyltransferase [Ktedonobacter sp. SOSP1-52]
MSIHMAPASTLPQPLADTFTRFADAADQVIPAGWQPERIAIIRALYVGDLLVSVPACRALRRRFPRSEITLIGLPWARTFAQHFPRYIDRFVEYAGYPGLEDIKTTPEKMRRFIAEQRAYGYDLVLQMHGSGRTSNALARNLGASITVGYYDPTQREASDLLTLTAPYALDWHEIYCAMGVAALAGCREFDPALEFPVNVGDRAEAEALLVGCVTGNRPLIGLHPGSKSPARRWPASYFARLADMLVERFGAQIVLTGGPGEEGTVAEVQRHMQAKALNCAAQTTIGGLAGLLNRYDLFISNDTGPAHLACALNRPSITLFGPVDVRRWAPLDQSIHRVARHPVPCSPCSHWSCPIDHRCLRWITPEHIYTMAAELKEKIYQ